MLTMSIDDDGRLVATQRDSSPTVYLDHWAFRELSTTPALAERFVAALKLRNGTLASSCTNLIEFCNVTDDQQTRRAEELLEATLPHVFFLEMDPFLVQKREDELLLLGAPPRPPHEDRELFTTLFRLKPQSVSVFTARMLFDGVRSGVGRQANELADTFVQQVAKLRIEHESDAAFQATLKRPPTFQKMQRGTRVILKELLRGLVLDRSTNLSRNHALDFLHAVVPVAYCDFVMLDKYWEDQVRRMRERLARASIDIPMAQVISKRSGGLECLVRSLEDATPV
jgi:hypothetical protein